MRVPMALPLDDGFLRRECPQCERQFKVRVEQTADALDDGEPTQTNALYFCPLCYESAPANAWWTKEQISYSGQIAMATVSDELHGMLNRAFGGLSQPSSPLRIEVEHGEIEEPKSMDEAHDMVRIDPPCHADTPLKVPEAWSGEVACFECGVRYPVAVVRTRH
jgi:hypothetical protein